MLFSSRAPRAAVVLGLVLTLLASACAAGSDAEGAASETPSSAAGAQDSPAGQTASGDSAGVEVAGAAGTKPQTTLPGGEPPTELVVVDLIEGDGAEVPEGATVTTDYVGVSWLNDGEEFDASWDRGEPATFPLSGVIPGWTEGIPGMREGGRRMLIIPPDQAYGAQAPSPAIAANDTLVFVIDMVSFEAPPEPVAPGTDDAGVEVGGEVGTNPEITLPGGEPPTELLVVDLVVGEGDEAPAGSNVTTDYVGVSWLNDGAEFDSSFDRGEPAAFSLTGVIEGWTVGIPGMKVGGRRLLIIPPSQAYGENPGSPDIAPNDTLVFVIDLVGVQ